MDTTAQGNSIWQTIFSSQVEIFGPDQLYMTNIVK